MKGSKLSQFAVGDHVSYSTKGVERTGHIHKLHASTASGVAEIKPSDGSRKVSRRLMHVRKEQS